MTATPSRSPWWLPAALGILLLVVTVPIFGMIPPDPAGIPASWGGAIYALEFAGTPEAFALAAGTGEPDAAERLDALRKMTVWDFGYAALYSAFMATWFLARHKATGAPWKLAAGFAILAGAADVTENIALISALSELQAGNPASAFVPATWVKFLAFGSTVAAAGYAIQDSGGLWRVVGWLVVVAGILVSVATVTPQTMGVALGTGIGIGWIAMIAYAIWRILKGHPA